ncbi:MAG: methionyl-tRNA formyltransferase [Zetaproteobacteria bacterium]|nr:MAG: methionyl-tRNA formyltransferase [Zetaproteobacteria bacterium]
MRKLSVVFAGSPAFAVPSLEALCAHAEIEVVGVITQPDRPKGRGMRVHPTPVKARALDLGLEVRAVAHPGRDLDALSWLRAKCPDFLVVVAFGALLPKSWLEAPRIAPVNVHPSLLPRWRGAAPIERALLAGDAETGVCIMQMTEGLDEGPIYACIRTPIDENDTGESLRARLAEMGARLLVDTLGRIADGLAPSPQEGTPTYAAKLTAEDRRLDWTLAAEDWDRRVRCFAPKPGARLRFRGRWLKVLAGRPQPQAGARGEVLAVNEAGIVLGLGEGSYRLELVQPEGKRAMDAAAFARGARLRPGMRWPNEA